MPIYNLASVHFVKICILLSSNSVDFMLISGYPPLIENSPWHIRSLIGSQDCPIVCHGQGLQLALSSGDVNKLNLCTLELIWSFLLKCLYVVSTGILGTIFAFQLSMCHGFTVNLSTLQKSQCYNICVCKAKKIKGKVISVRENFGSQDSISCLNFGEGLIKQLPILCLYITQQDSVLYLY